MSSGDRFPFPLAKQLARVADEAILGAALSCIAAAVHSLVNFIRCSSALKKIRDAPSVDASGLRSLLLQRNDGFSDGEEVLVVVRGTVSALNWKEGNWIKSVAAELTQSVADKMVAVAEEEFVKPAVKRWVELDMDLEGSFDKFMKGHWIKWGIKRGWLHFHPSAEGLLSSSSVERGGVVVQKTLLSSSSGDRGVVLQKTRSCIYNGIFKAKDWRLERSNTRAVPFALKQGVQQSELDYLVVSVGKSKHPLPLVTVNRHIQSITTPYNFLLALFRRDVVGVLEEEKVLFPGKEITAVGVCSLKGEGVPKMKSCSNLPYFLSEMRKDEMVAVMTGDMKARMWFSIVAGSVSIALLGYAMARYWRRWKERRWQRAMRRREKALESQEGEAHEDQLCVVCLTTRRQSAFVPCGHLVCCRSCAALVAGKKNPQCPICRQSLQGSLRVYVS